MQRNLRNVLVVSGVRGDTRRYRTLHLFEQFRLCGVPVDYAQLSEPGLSAKLSRPWDLVVFHRVPCVGFIRGPIERLREKRAIILSDFDDLIFDPSAFQFINSPDFSDPIRKRLYIQTMEQIRDMLAQSEGSTASTGYLADQIRGMGKPAWVHRNAFSLKMLAIAERARSSRNGGAGDHTRPIVIGYASGTPTHNRDFETIRPALKKVLANYPQAELRLIGPLDAGGEWGALGERVKRLKLVPWQNLPALLAEFDINLAPLVTDNPFAQSKSEIKYMEAGMVGVPTIASPTEAFCYAIRNGKNGFLAQTGEEWFETIAALIDKPSLRMEIGENAYQAVQAEYHPAVRARQLAEELEEIVKAVRGSSFWGGSSADPEKITAQARQAAAEGGWIPEKHEKETSYFFKALYSLRAAGIGVTLQLVWIYFRRMIAPVIPYRKQ